MTGVVKLRLFWSLTAALLNFVVFVYNDVVQRCATWCTSFRAGGRVKMPNFVL